MSSLRKQSLYFIVVGTVGLILALFFISDIWQKDFSIFLFLIVLSSLLEAMPIPLRQSLSSLLPVVPIGAMVAYNTGFAIWSVIIASLAVPIFVREWNWLTAFFNAGQYAVSVFCMAYAFHCFEFGNSDSFDLQLLCGVVYSACVFVAVNHLLIHILYVIRGTWIPSMVLGALVTDLANLAIGLPFALLMIVVSPAHPLIGPIVILPIVILAYLLRVHRQTRDLQFVHHATTRLASEFDTKAIASEAAKIARRITTADAVGIFFVDKVKARLVPEVVYPPSRTTDFRPEGYAESNGSVIWRAIREREHIYIADTRRDKRVRYDKDGRTYLSMAVFPMHAHMEMQGAIVCYGERPHAFAYSMNYVTALANQVSVLLENARLYQELQEHVRRDAATGLYNYRYFYEELAKRLAISANEEKPISVLIVDIDFFKKLNDTYGHLAGDAVLKEVGQILQAMCFDGAFAARYGGEEFALLVPLSSEETYRFAERIRESIRQLSIHFQGYKLQGITVSIGFASYPKDSTNDRDLILKADSAMYWGAKQRGRNRVALYSPEFDAQLFVDSLTGLYTFYFINIRVNDEVVHGAAHWCAICLDLQQFSHINNTFGFVVGDQILRQTGVLIRECLRHAELACRYGGDEVLILLPGVTESEARNVQERILRAISSHRFQIGDNVVLSLRAHATHAVLTDVLDGADLFNRVSSLFEQLQTPANHSMA